MYENSHKVACTISAETKFQKELLHETLVEKIYLFQKIELKV